MVKKKLARKAFFPICRLEANIREHLFLLYSWTTALWFGQPTLLNTSSLNVWFDYLFEFSSDSRSGEFSTIPITLFSLWLIWKSRNLQVFEDKNPNSMETFMSVRAFSSDFIASKGSPNSNPIPIVNPHVRVTLEWHPPRCNYIKISSDAQFDVSRGKGCSRTICRNSKSDVVSGFTSNFFLLLPMLLKLQPFVKLFLWLQILISLVLSLNQIFWSSQRCVEKIVLEEKSSIY